METVEVRKVMYKEVKKRKQKKRGKKVRRRVSKKRSCIVDRSLASGEKKRKGLETWHFVTS